LVVHWAGVWVPTTPGGAPALPETSPESMSFCRTARCGAMNQGFMEKLGRFSQENGKKNEKIWESIGKC